MAIIYKDYGNLFRLVGVAAFVVMIVGLVLILKGFRNTGFGLLLFGAVVFMLWMNYYVTSSIFYNSRSAVPSSSSSWFGIANRVNQPNVELVRVTGEGVVAQPDAVGMVGGAGGAAVGGSAGPRG